MESLTESFYVEVAPPVAMPSDPTRFQARAMEQAQDDLAVPRKPSVRSGTYRGYNRPTQGEVSAP